MGSVAGSRSPQSRLRTESVHQDFLKRGVACWESSVRFGCGARRRQGYCSLRYRREEPVASNRRAHQSELQPPERDWLAAAKRVRRLDRSRRRKSDSGNGVREVVLRRRVARKCDPGITCGPDPPIVEAALDKSDHELSAACKWRCIHSPSYSF